MLWLKFRFTPCHGENSDFHHAVVKNSDLHYAVVKIQIFTTFTPHHGENQIFITFTPHHGENSDFHDIYTTSW